MRVLVSGDDRGPGVRLRRGKPAAGKIEVTVTETSAELACGIRDDGGGIDVDALRDRAVRRGLLTARAALQLTHSEASVRWSPILQHGA